MFHHTISIYRLRNVLFLGVLLLTLVGCGGEQPTPTAVAIAPTSTPTPTPKAVPAIPTPAPVPTPSVGEPVVSVPSPVDPDEQIGISVAVDGVAGVEIAYEWIPPEGKGKILDGQGTSAITYQAPTEPGTYKIGLKVRAAGTVIERSAFITIEKPTDTPTPTELPVTDTPTPIDTPTPTKEPTPKPPEATPPQPGECPFDEIPYRTSIEGPPVDVEVSIESIPNCADNLPTAASIPLRGTYSGDLAGKEIWILVYPPNVVYYPQSEDACRNLPAQFANGQWSTIIRLGRPGVPEAFHVVAVVTDVGSPASEAFRNYLTVGCNTGNYQGLMLVPVGATELDSIIVHTK